MSRRACPDLYPDPRPTRLFVPLLPYFPALLRLLPWLTLAPVIGAFAVLLVTALPLVTWALLCVAVLAPLGAGLLFTVGWE